MIFSYSNVSSLALSIVILMSVNGCVLSLGSHADGGHFSAHWIDFDADKKLSDLVHLRLQQDPLTHDSTIYASADEGHIYLIGSSSRTEVLSRAIEIAKSTEGVDSVLCQVTIVK